MHHSHLNTHAHHTQKHVVDLSLRDEVWGAREMAQWFALAEDKVGFPAPTSDGSQLL